MEYNVLEQLGKIDGVGPGDAEVQSIATEVVYDSDAERSYCQKSLIRL